MRASLDYLVYELSPPEVRKKRKTQFPIFTEESDFKKYAPSMIEGITGDNRDVIERMQPYNQTNVAANDPLAILNELSNRDKHRLLIPMIAAVDRMSVWVSSDNAEFTSTFSMVAWWNMGRRSWGSARRRKTPPRRCRCIRGRAFRSRSPRPGRTCRSRLSIS